MDEIKVWPDPVEVKVTYRPKAPSDMVERVARAIWAQRVRFAKEVNGVDLEAYTQTTGFVEAGNEFATVANMNGILGEAQAAIEALREPTEEMADAVDSPFRAELLRDWQAMIDAALKHPAGQ